MTRTEARSETERHWDNIAMGLIAVATAAAAAVFLIMGKGEPRAEPAGDLDVFISVMSFMATLMYVGTGILAGAGIFGNSNLQEEERTRWKRSITHDAFSIF